MRSGETSCMNPLPQFFKADCGGYVAYTTFFEGEKCPSVNLYNLDKKIDTHRVKGASMFLKYLAPGSRP